MKRVIFSLTMPGRPSWNGRWSGNDHPRTQVRNLPNSIAAELHEKDWQHSWDDGWTAHIKARLMLNGERKPKTFGFCGYDWMIDNILQHGTTCALDT